MLDQIPFLHYAIGAFIGLGLAAASGFRVFLPLFTVSLGSYLGWVPVNDSFEWLASLPTLLATGTAMIIEIAAYYIPFVDNLLDTLSVPLATIAGSLLFASQFTELGTFSQWALALIAGGGTAAVISMGFAGTRAASSATTAGIGNSTVATTETAGAGILSVLSFLVPLVAALVAIGLIVVVFILGRKAWHKILRKKKSPTTIIEVDTIDNKRIE